MVTTAPSLLPIPVATPTLPRGEEAPVEIGEPGGTVAASGDDEAMGFLALLAGMLSTPRPVVETRPAPVALPQDGGVPSTVVPTQDGESPPAPAAAMMVEITFSESSPWRPVGASPSLPTLDGSGKDVGETLRRLFPRPDTPPAATQVTPAPPPLAAPIAAKVLVAVQAAAEVPSPDGVTVPATRAPVPATRAPVPAMTPSFTGAEHVPTGRDGVGGESVASVDPEAVAPGAAETKFRVASEADSGAPIERVPQRTFAERPIQASLTDLVAGQQALTSAEDSSGAAARPANAMRELLADAAEVIPQAARPDQSVPRAKSEAGTVAMVGVLSVRVDAEANAEQSPDEPTDHPRRQATEIGQEGVAPPSQGNVSLLSTSESAGMYAAPPHTSVRGGLAAAGGHPGVPSARPEDPAPVMRNDQTMVVLDQGDGGDRVRVSVRGSVVHATILTDAAQQESLISRVDDLRRALGERGFTDAHVAIRAAPTQGEVATMPAALGAPTSERPIVPQRSGGSPSSYDGAPKRHPAHEETADEQGRRRPPQQEDFE